MNKQFPNTLGTLAAATRLASADRERLLHIHTALTSAIADLTTMRARCETSAWNHAYAHLTDAEQYITRLLGRAERT